MQSQEFRKNKRSESLKTLNFSAGESVTLEQWKALCEKNKGVVSRISNALDVTYFALRQALAKRKDFLLLQKIIKREARERALKRNILTFRDRGPVTLEQWKQLFGKHNGSNWKIAEALGISYPSLHQSLSRKKSFRQYLQKGKGA